MILQGESGISRKHIKMNFEWNCVRLVTSDMTVNKTVSPDGDKHYKGRNVWFNPAPEMKRLPQESLSLILTAEAHEMSFLKFDVEESIPLVRKYWKIKIFDTINQPLYLLIVSWYLKVKLPCHHCVIKPEKRIKDQ